MQRAAIYCRLSEEDRNKTNALSESESIQNQKAMLTAYARDRGWDVYKIYCDEDYSGIDANRPMFNKLLSDAENKRFDIVLCKTQSRFTRDMEVLEKYIHNKFLEWNIRFIALVDNADSENKGNKKARQINGLINEWFLEDLSDNIRSVLTDKRKRGQYIGSFYPFGYLKDPADKNSLVVDPDASKVVRQVFSLYLDGYGITRIAQMLNEKGVPNPTAYKIIKGQPYRCANLGGQNSGLWSGTTVREMLKNRIYTGCMVQGKYKNISYKNQKLVRMPEPQWIIVEDTHEPIIDKDTFDKAQLRLNSYAHPQKEGKVSAFAGKIVCMNCQRPLHKGYSKQVPYFKCRTKELSKSACEGVNIRCSEVEEAVLHELNYMAGIYGTPGYLKERIKESLRLDKEVQNIEKKKLAVAQEIKKTSDILLGLYSDKAEGKITQMQFDSLCRGLMEKEKLLERDYCEIESLSLTRGDDDPPASQIFEVISKYSCIKELGREMADAFISRIEVGREGNGGKVLNIYWKI